ncbi:MAG TPA: response regulator transcription factor [Streptosporangiaceae bacterium]|nr:response regulator transcription factor [Streptosporangiaceae bacterium]
MNGLSARPGESPPGSSRILVVDDEQAIRDLIGRALVTAGYSADLAAGGAAGLEMIASRDYGLVILDLVMPDLDGRTFLTRLQATRNVPAVLVLSCVDDVATKVSCLELGAQDYLTKPFSLAEFLARVRVRLRDDTHLHAEIIRAGGLVLDVWRLKADIGNGPVSLTKLEFLLLRELAEHVGQPLRKDELLASIWGLDFDPGSNVVDVCVRRLRSKLGFDLIKTVRGAGYQLTS